MGLKYPQPLLDSFYAVVVHDQFICLLGDINFTMSVHPSVRPPTPIYRVRMDLSLKEICDVDRPLCMIHFYKAYNQMISYT